MTAPAWPALTWPETMPAYGPVVLRPFRADDLHLVHEVAADPYVPEMTSVPRDVTDATARDWLDRQHDRLTDGTGWSFAVADAAGDRAVGQIGLWTRGLAGGRASIGYLVAPHARGRGIAGAALTAVTAYAWTVPGLFRLELYIEPWNTGSIRTAGRGGYAYEGLLRSHQEIGGTRRDMCLYAALRPGA